jgi:hypothetical protein
MHARSARSKRRFLPRASSAILGGAASRRARWLFDAPVSNSGRIKSLLLDWHARMMAVDVEIVMNPIQFWPRAKN